MSQDTVVKIVGAVVGWLIFSGLITLGIARWYRIQRELDERDRMEAWRREQRAMWGVTPNGTGPQVVRQRQ